MSEYKATVDAGNANDLRSRGSLFGMHNSPSYKKAWVIGGVVILILATLGIIFSETTTVEALSDAVCALTCGLSLTIIGCLLAVTIIGGGWSVSHECFGSRNAGYGLGGAATVCVILLVLGISGISFGLTHLLPYLF